MSRVEAAAAMDRLPWLPDEPAKHAAHRRSGRALMLALVVAVAVSAFWFGTRRADEQAMRPATSPRPAATVRLPAARQAIPAPPQVKIAPVPEIEPVVAPPTPVIEAPPTVTRTPPKTIAPPREEVSAAPAVEAAPSPPQPWPVRVIEGADGRLVRVGAFNSVHQAKRGWWAIVRVNPALKHLPALVVRVQSRRNGRVYYRLQMGTTSQAHSAVLCQRMRMIAEPCVVIGTAA